MYFRPEFCRAGIARSRRTSEYSRCMITQPAGTKSIAETRRSAWSVFTRDMPAACRLNDQTEAATLTHSPRQWPRRPPPSERALRSSSSRRRHSRRTELVATRSSDACARSATRLLDSRGNHACRAAGRSCRCPALPAGKLHRRQHHRARYSSAGMDAIAGEVEALKHR